MSPLRTSKRTVYDLKYHLVWIPKYRKKLLTGEVARFTRRTFKRIAREYGWEIEEMSVQSDHVHLFVHVPPKYAPAQVVQIMKSISAREIFETFPRLRKRLWAGEFWGDGYFARSVGDKVTTAIIERYIRSQNDTPSSGQLPLWED
jgi:putative transposase